MQAIVIYLYDFNLGNHVFQTIFAHGTQAQPLASSCQLRYVTTLVFIIEQGMYIQNTIKLILQKKDMLLQQYNAYLHATCAIQHIMQLPWLAWSLDWSSVEYL